jgi:hypothetical protein
LLGDYRPAINLASVGGVMNPLAFLARRGPALLAMGKRYFSAFGKVDDFTPSDSK